MHINIIPKISSEWLGLQRQTPAWRNSSPHWHHTHNLVGLMVGNLSISMDLHKAQYENE